MALMLLQDSRRASRTDDSGAPVPPAEQDRDRWNRAAIEEGLRILASVPVASAGRLLVDHGETGLRRDAG